MEKVPFTSEGIARKQAELYALTPSELNTQAQSIAANFPGWMLANFTLNKAQNQYLADMPEEFGFYLGEELSSSVVIKLPIKVELPDYPLIDSGSKRIKVNKSSSKSLNLGTPTATTGQLLIQVTYDR